MTRCCERWVGLCVPSVGRNGGNKVRGARISEEDMRPAHQISGVGGACTGLVDVFHTQRVCPVGNPCSLPRAVLESVCQRIYGQAIDFTDAFLDQSQLTEKPL